MPLLAIIAAATLVLLVLLAIYLTATALDWRANADLIPPHLQPTYRAHLVADLDARRHALVQRWSKRLRTWARTWWWLVIVAAGAFGCVRLLGARDYLLSWGGTGFRAISGAVLGYLVSRLLLRIDVSAIADKYPMGSEAQAEAAGKATVGLCFVVAACILAMANGT